MKLILSFTLLLIGVNLIALDTTKTVAAKPKIIYGTASYYSNSFNGKKTANGEIYSQKKNDGRL